MAVVWLGYYTAIYLLVWGIRISAWWNPKHALWWRGRKNWREQIKSFSKKEQRRIWFHVSSLGEFEQARPVMEKLKQDRPQWQIILSFFSPSGYEIRKNYSLAHVVYLPADLRGNAKAWINHIQPDLAIFVKYDFWPGYLFQLTKRDIPFVVISANFKTSGTLQAWKLPPTRQLLKKSKMIFLQRADHLDQLKNAGFNLIQVAGDTRVDRCVTLPEEASRQLPNNLKVASPFDLVAGSTWPEDEKVLIPAIESLDLKAIIAPHDISDSNIRRLMASLPFPAVRYSAWKESDQVPKVIIMDSIGLLPLLYALCSYAFVGGGFGKGIHNILEPAAHGKPVVFGPRYHAFHEAVDLIREGGAIAVQHTSELISAIERFRMDHEGRHGSIAKNFILSHQGATEKITSYLLDSIPFDN